MTITLGSKLPFAAKVTMVRFEPSLLFASGHWFGHGLPATILFRPPDCRLSQFRTGLPATAERYCRKNDTVDF
jgi:hypothetical protein